MTLGSASVRHCRLRLKYQTRVEEFPKNRAFLNFLGGPSSRRSRKSRWSRVGTSKIILDFYPVICLVRWIMGRLGQVGREVVKKAWLSMIIKIKLGWLSRSMILPLGTFPWLSLSVIHAKTEVPTRLHRDFPSFLGHVLEKRTNFRKFVHFYTFSGGPQVEVSFRFIDS